MNKSLEDKLNKRKEEGTLRSLSSYTGFIDFHSNDYLGLSKKELFIDKKSAGGTGSRLISGTSDDLLSIEKELANFYGGQEGLFFNSGYDANLGVFSSIPQKGDLVVYDEHIHASIRDGLRLSLAKNYSFQHNNLDDLERLLQKEGTNKYIAVESLYSMHGDFAPLRKIVDLAHKYNAHVILDEAHACGLYGFDGRGVANALELQNQIGIRIHTFGKAYGRHGAMVISDSTTISFLVNFARSFIYTTALPDSVANEVLTLTNSNFTNERLKLWKNIELFRSKMNPKHLISAVNSPIQIVHMSPELAKERVERAANNKIALKAILPPTVPEGQEGIRICIHSFNTAKEIELLVTCL